MSVKLIAVYRVTHINVWDLIIIIFIYIKDIFIS